MPTPVINQIMANITTTLAGVTVANGYQRTIKVVDRPEQLPVSPATGTVLLRKAADEISPWQEVPTGWTRHNQAIDVLVYVPWDEDQSGPVDDEMQVWGADILRALRVDINRGNIANDTKPAPDEEIYPDEGVFSFAARVIVEYDTLWNDPYHGRGAAA
jgi:hypothetical protein